MDKHRDSYRKDAQDPTEDILLPTVSLIHVPHPTIPNLYQRCFEYVERGQWDWETELVETGRWFYTREPEGGTGKP